MNRGQTVPRERPFELGRSPDQPPPQDFSFPGWEASSRVWVCTGDVQAVMVDMLQLVQQGPVFVAQLFGLADTMCTLLRVRCLGWRLFGGGWFLLGPVAFTVISTLKVRKLVKVEKTLCFKPSPKRSLWTMWKVIKDLPGVTATVLESQKGALSSRRRRKCRATLALPRPQWCVEGPPIVSWTGDIPAPAATLHHMM